jgi:hypothetical protein
MDEITLSIKPEDAELLLTVMSQVNCVGKEGAIQLLRIIHALENAIKIDEVA